MLIEHLKAANIMTFLNSFLMPLIFCHLLQNAYPPLACYSGIPCLYWELLRIYWKSPASREEKICINQK